MDLKKFIRNIPDFPKPGIQFKDIESITENPEAFAFVTEQISSELAQRQVDKILVLDARGFLFGAAVGYKDSLPIILARKSGKLAGESVTENYALEYGEASVQLQKSAVSPGDKVAIVDDLLATGGTAAAAAKLVHKLGGEVEVFTFVIELADLGGRAQLSDVDVVSLCQF